ncbi:unnamed protein product [Rhizophagus irregularis]|nr:unnamed protein product [Rhizophagus irregularis]
MFEEINDLDFENPSVDLPLEDEINLFEFFINKFVEEHNHMLNSQELLHQFAPSLRKIPVDVKEEICFLVQDCQLGATILKRILRKKFPDQEIYHQDLYNMIYKFKIDAQIKNDAVIFYEHVMKLQQEDSDWYFNVDFEGIKVEKEEQVAMWHMQILVS